MDLNRIATFVRVVDEGGFTAAARALGLPKSSVSRSIALLERELGARLLMRSTRAVKLTEAGAAFYARVTQGLAAIAEARETVIDLEAQLGGRIRITAPVDAGSWMLAPIVAAFVDAHPAVTIDVVLTGRVVDLVEEGFDLALRAGRLRDGSLIARKLAKLDFGLYAAPSYLETRGAPKTPADLAGHRFVSFRSPTMTLLLVGPHGEETVDVSGSVMADDFSFVFHAVAAGAGIGLLPAFMAQKRPDVIERVLRDRTMPGNDLHLVYPSARYVPRRVAAFRDFVVERLG